MLLLRSLLPPPQGHDWHIPHPIPLRHIALQRRKVRAIMASHGQHVQIGSPTAPLGESASLQVNLFRFDLLHQLTLSMDKNPGLVCFVSCELPGWHKLYRIMQSSRLNLLFVGALKHLVGQAY